MKTPCSLHGHYVNGCLACEANDHNGDKDMGWEDNGCKNCKAIDQLRAENEELKKQLSIDFWQQVGEQTWKNISRLNTRARTE